jgi:hypothetical protein
MNFYRDERRIFGGISIVEISRLRIQIIKKKRREKIEEES